MKVASPALAQGIYLPPWVAGRITSILVIEIAAVRRAPGGTRGRHAQRRRRQGATAGLAAAAGADGGGGRGGGRGGRPGGPARSPAPASGSRGRTGKP